MCLNKEVTYDFGGKMRIMSRVKLSIRSAIAVLVSLVLVAGNVTDSYAAGSTAQSISWTTNVPTPKFVGDTDFTPSGATSTSALAVTYGVTNSAGICSFTGAGKISLDGIGTCTVTANQAGDATYAAATQVTSTFYLMPAEQKNFNGLTVCFTSPWTHCEVNGLSYGWDYSTSKYTTWAMAGETATVLANQSSNAAQLNGGTVGQIRGTATGFYTNTSGATENLSCSISMSGTGSHNVTIGATSLSISVSNGSSSSSRSGTIAAGATVAVTSVFQHTSYSGPGRWIVPCTIGGRNFTTDSFTSSIRPSISTVAPSSGLTAGGTNIVITGANFGATGATVTIDGVSCPVVGSHTATSITCTVPSSGGVSKLANVVVTASDGSSGTKVGGYSYEAASYPVPTNSAAPVASTSAAAPYAVGSSIASTLGTWSMNGDPTTTTTVQWQVCATAQSLLCTDIAGATGTPWSSTADVAGKYLRSAVTATNNGGSTVAYSNILGPFAKATQSISIAAITSKSVGVADFYPAITYNPSTPLRVATLGSTTPAVCTIVDNKIHVVGNGNCAITADLAEGDTFTAATQQNASFQVVAPTFTGGTSPTAPKWNVAYSYQYVYSNPNATFSITSGALPAGLTMSSSGLITGTTLEKPLVAPYNFTVSATDASGTQTVDSTITIAKGTLRIVSSGVHGFVSSNGKLYAVVDSARNPGAIVQNGTQPITPIGQEVGWWWFTTNTAEICEVTRGGLLTVKKAGFCNLSLNTDAPNWTAGLLFSDIWTQNVAAPKPLKANTITFAQPVAVARAAADFTPAATATSGVKPTFTSSTPAVCIIVDGKVRLVATGTCTISAADAGSATFNSAAAVTRSFEVLPSPDAPTITAATAVGAAGSSALVTFTPGPLNGWTLTGYQVSATPANGTFGFPATVSCPTAGVACAVPGLTPGVEYNFIATTLASNGPATAKVNSLPSSPVLVRLPQTIELASPGLKRPDAGSFALFPTSDVGSTIKPVVTSSTPSVCTVDVNNVVTIVGAGTCTLAANSDAVVSRGASFGAAAPVTVSFSVAATAPSVTTASPLAGAQVGVAVSIANTAAAGSAVIPTTAGTWSATGLPEGLVIDTKTGKISGTPASPGVYDRILVTVKDKAGVIASKPLSLTVSAAPGIVGPTTVAVVAGVLAVVDVLTALPGTAAIPSTGAWAVTAGTLPAGLTLNPNTGVVTGTPTGVVGKVTVTITLTDSAPLTANKVLTFDVAAAPTIANSSTPETVNAVAGKKLASPIVPAVTAGTAGKPAKGAWTFVPVAPSLALPDGLVFNPDTGAVSGTPSVAGNYTFDAVFTDAKGLKATKRYNLVVANPPSINTSLMLPVYTIGTSPALNVTQVKAAGSATIPATGAWAEVGNVLAGLGLAINADTGAITGTPTATTTKDLKFTLKLTDSAGLTDQVTFTLPVIKAGTNKTTLNLPVEIAGGTLITDTKFDLTSPAAGVSSMGLPVTYTVTATSITSCYIDADKKLNIIGTGVCGVTATSGTAAAKNVSSATQAFNVLKASQVLTVTAPGEVVEGSEPEVTADEATDDPAGFKISATLSSELDPVFTVIPAKNPNGSDRDPNCTVDETGTVSWLYDMLLTATSPGYDVNGNKCRVAISHPGDRNYGAVPTQYLDLSIVHVTPSEAGDDSGEEPAVSVGLPRTGGTIMKGGNGFTVKVTPTGVTVQPKSVGKWIGPITADIKIEYTKNGETLSQSCFTAFGIAIKDSKGKIVTNPALETKAAITAITKPYRAMPKNGPKGYLSNKVFSNSITCALNKDAVAFFKAGGQIKATAVVIRDRRWPTTYKRQKLTGEAITPTIINWNLTVG